MRAYVLMGLFGILFAGLLHEFSVATVLGGLLLAWVVTIILRVWRRDRRLPIHPIRLARFAWDFMVDLTVSNLRMAWDVVTPTDYHEVHLIYVPVDDLTDGEIVLLSHRITLTPGTLTCDLTWDHRFLIIHVMYPQGTDMATALRRPIDILKGNA